MSVTWSPVSLLVLGYGREDGRMEFRQTPPGSDTIECHRLPISTRYALFRLFVPLPVSDSFLPPVAFNHAVPFTLGEFEPTRSVFSGPATFFTVGALF